MKGASLEVAPKPPLAAIVGEAARAAKKVQHHVLNQIIDLLRARPHVPRKSGNDRGIPLLKLLPCDVSRSGIFVLQLLQETCAGRDAAGCALAGHGAAPWKTLTR